MQVGPSVDSQDSKEVGPLEGNLEPVGLMLPIQIDLAEQSLLHTLAVKVVLLRIDLVAQSLLRSQAVEEVVLPHSPVVEGNHRHRIQEELLEVELLKPYQQDKRYHLHQMAYLHRGHRCNE